MSDLAQRRVRNIVSRLDLWRYRAKARLERPSRAWRYFTGRLTADDAQRVMLDCRDPAGWHPLLILTVEDTLEQARETFADHPSFRGWSPMAAPVSATNGNPTATSSTKPAAGRSISPKSTPPPRTSRLFGWTTTALQRPPTPRTILKEMHHERIHRQNRLLASRL